MSMSVKPKLNKRGFTLLETLVSFALGTMVIAALLSVFINYLMASDRTNAWGIAGQKASFAITKMTRGATGRKGLREFVPKDSNQPTTDDPDDGSWKFEDVGGNYYWYKAGDKKIVDNNGSLIAKNVVTSSVDVVVYKGTYRVTVVVGIKEQVGMFCSTGICSTVVMLRNL